MVEVGKALPEYVDVSISYEVAKAKVSAVVRRPSTDVTYGQMLATLKAVKMEAKVNSLIISLA